MTTGPTGPAATSTDPVLKTFYVKSRRTSPIMFDTVEAPTRDDAIHVMVNACPPGDQIEILQVEETPYTDGPPVGGATGATGATGAARTKAKE